MIWETVEEWRHCRHGLLAAIATTGGTHTEDDILAAIMTGKMKLWRRESSGLVTEFVQFPQMKTLNIFLAGGKLKELEPLAAEIEKHAIQSGCRRITALHAHAGWAAYFGDTAKIGGTFAYKDI